MGNEITVKHVWPMLFLFRRINWNSKSFCILNVINWRNIIIWIGLIKYISKHLSLFHIIFSSSCVLLLLFYRLCEHEHHTSFTLCFWLQWFHSPNSFMPFWSSDSSLQLPTLQIIISCTVTTYTYAHIYKYTNIILIIWTNSIIIYIIKALGMKWFNFMLFALAQKNKLLLAMHIPTFIHSSMYNTYFQFVFLSTYSDFLCCMHACCCCTNELLSR